MKIMNACAGVILLIGLAATGMGAATAPAAPALPGAPADALAGVGIDQKLGAQVPVDLTFTDEVGSQLTLGQLQRGKPIVVALVQYRCPSLCTVVLNDMLSSLKMVPMDIGNQYDVWTVSFDPKEGPDLAADKKREYLQSYERAHAANPDVSAGWHFLTGDAANIHAFTEAVGFHYKWDERTQQFIHPAGLLILTPEGKVSRYFFGVDYDPTDLRLALVEASGGKVGTFTDQVLLYCYHYDPTTGRYNLVITRALEIGAGMTLVMLGLVLGGLWTIDRRRTKRGLALVARGAGKAAHA